MKLKLKGLILQSNNYKIIILRKMKLKLKG